MFCVDNFEIKHANQHFNKVMFIYMEIPIKSVLQTDLINNGNWRLRLTVVCKESILSVKLIHVIVQGVIGNIHSPTNPF